MLFIHKAKNVVEPFAQRWVSSSVRWRAHQGKLVQPMQLLDLFVS